MYQFKFADIGEGLHEGKVIKIHVNVGDNVKDGDVLFEVETDKVTSEITAPVSGKITSVKIQEQTTVHVGDVVFEIDDNPTASAPEEDGESKPAAGGASVVGQVVVSDEVLSFDFGSKKKSSASSNTTKSTSPASLQPVPKGLKIAPRLRKLAAEKGVDLNLVVATGPNNTVLEVDLDKALAAKPTVAPVSVPKGLKIAPRLRKMATEKGVDLSLVVPTGPNGTVVEADLDKALAAKVETVTESTVTPEVVSMPASAPVPTPTPAPTSAPASVPASQPNTVNTGFVARRVKTTAMREAIAKNLKNS